MKLKKLETKIKFNEDDHPHLHLLCERLICMNDSLIFFSEQKRSIKKRAIAEARRQFSELKDKDFSIDHDNCTITILSIL